MGTKAKPKKRPVKVRLVCKHPGRLWNRCSNCPLRKR